MELMVSAAATRAPQAAASCAGAPETPAAEGVWVRISPVPSGGPRGALHAPEPAALVELSLLALAPVDPLGPGGDELGATAPS